MRQAYRLAALTFMLVALVAAGCGTKNPSSPGGGGNGGTTADFTAAVQAATLSGAVLPTTLAADASLLTTYDVDGMTAGGALFVSSGSFVDAGTVTVTSAGTATVPEAVDTLARRSVLVNYAPWTYYSSLPNLPAPLPLSFDGSHWHRFRVSGTAAFGALDDSVLSVARPAVIAPAVSSDVAESADLGIAWSDAGTDTTVYVLPAIRSNADTAHVALGVLVRDVAGHTSIPQARLASLPTGPARLAVARFRLVRHTVGAHAVQLLCEGVTLQYLTLVASVPATATR